MSPMNPRLQLFLVSKQFYNEASAVFFAENVFRFYSANVKSKKNPFGLQVSRVRCCYLQLSWNPDPEFLFRYLQAFVKVLRLKKDLQYLLVTINDQRLSSISALETLNNIHFVQIDMIDVIVDYVSFTDSRQGNYRQLLERSMMSDGSVQKAIRETLPETYSNTPALQPHLRGEFLDLAKRDGGWRYGHDLFEYLHFDRMPRRAMQDVLSLPIKELLGRAGHMRPQKKAIELEDQIRSLRSLLADS
ncbi:MAG: hypothetical protein Q9170_002028 [Blastenia crenularia]